MNDKVRLQKIIAENSEYSRRKAEELIANNQVTVNGEIVNTLGYKASYKDEIKIDNNTIYFHEKVYYLINKPINYICSRKDNFNRPIITDLIHEPLKIYPVGRLDYNTSGLILLTNDGELTNGLLHPKYKIPKTYIAKVKGVYSKKDLFDLAKGIVIDNYKTQPAKVKSLKYNKKTQVGEIEITIYEGKNLQVRKMLRKINLKVLKLKRIKLAFFDISIEKLAPGEYRELKVKEIKQLYNLFK